jgi:hypothetical protein
VDFRRCDVGLCGRAMLRRLVMLTGTVCIHCGLLMSHGRALVCDGGTEVGVRAVAQCRGDGRLGALEVHGGARVAASQASQLVSEFVPALIQRASALPEPLVAVLGHVLTLADGCAMCRGENGPGWSNSGERFEPAVAA